MIGEKIRALIPAGDKFEITAVFVKDKVLVDGSDKYLVVPVKKEAHIYKDKEVFIIPPGHIISFL